MSETILTSKTLSTRKETCPSATYSATNPIRNGMGFNLVVQSEKLQGRRHALKHQMYLNYN